MGDASGLRRSKIGSIDRHELKNRWRARIFFNNTRLSKNFETKELAQTWLLKKYMEYLREEFMWAKSELRDAK